MRPKTVRGSLVWLPLPSKDRPHPVHRFEIVARDGDAGVEAFDEMPPSDGYEQQIARIDDGFGDVCVLQQGEIGEGQVIEVSVTVVPDLVIHEVEFFGWNHTDQFVATDLRQVDIAEVAMHRRRASSGTKPEKHATDRIFTIEVS